MASYNLCVGGKPAPRATDVFYSEVLDTGRRNINAVNFFVENGLDQNVSCQPQGKASHGTAWIDIGSATVVNKTANGYFAVSGNFGQLRLKVTPADIPTTGSLGLYAEAGFSGAVL